MNNYSPKSLQRSGIILKWLLTAYLALYFVFPYKLLNLPISLHSVVLLAGTMFLCFVKWAECKNNGRLFSAEDVFLGVVILFFICSAFVVHYAGFSLAGFQPYMFSFLCFYFVKETMETLRLSSISSAALLYLAVSGLLILLQVYAGDVFYIAKYFETSGINPAHQGWGFANFHVVAGGIHMWLLSIVIAFFSLEDDPARSRYVPQNLVIAGTALGSIGLYFAASRAAWLGMLFVYFLLFTFLLIYHKPMKRFLTIFLFALLSVVLANLIFANKTYRLDDKVGFAWNVAVSPFETLKTDVSAHTKLKAWKLAGVLILKHPVWGIGLDQFPAYYAKEYANIDYKNENIDPELTINASSSYLSYMVEVGLLPALLLFALFGSVLIRGFKNRSDRTSLSYLIGFMGVCVWALPSDYLKERTFWIAFAMLSGGVNSKLNDSGLNKDD